MPERLEPERVAHEPEGAGQPVRLTQQVKAGGCASKLAPGLLTGVLARLPLQRNDRVLVGFETADDAGVYRLTDDQALVQTVDFFTPMVDDPFTFGRIAATNALSDVYAMGGRPVTALSVVGFPATGDPAVLEAVLRGGLSVMDDAGCVVVGGHSVQDSEMKFGYAVTGLIDPRHVLRNTGAQPGDAVVFTKALGTGVITTALKQGKAEGAWVEAAIASMTTLNRRAAELAVQPAFQVHAMTDVTGFGLMGHARELAFGSGVQLRLRPGALSALPGALEAVERGCVPGGLRANQEFAACVVDGSGASGLSEAWYALLFDPQTAGGLLITLPAECAEGLVTALRDGGYGHAAVIGAVQAGKPGIALEGTGAREIG